MNWGQECTRRQKKLLQFHNKSYRLVPVDLEWSQLMKNFIHLLESITSKGLYFDTNVPLLMMKKKATCQWWIEVFCREKSSCTMPTRHEGLNTTRNPIVIRTWEVESTTSVQIDKYGLLRSLLRNSFCWNIQNLWINQTNLWSLWHEMCSLLPLFLHDSMTCTLLVKMKAKHQ